jgi:hypothetical protein
VSPRIGIDDVPLTAPVEPDGVRFAQVLDELGRVRDFRIVGVEHLHVLQSALQPPGDSVLLLVLPRSAIVSPVAASRRHDDEFRVGPAGELDEFLHDAGAVHASAADDHERAFGRTVFGRLLKGSRRG